MTPPTLDERLAHLDKVILKSDTSSHQYHNAVNERKGILYAKREVYKSWQEMDSVQFMYYIGNLGERK